jgi:hypothetical protein
MQLGKKRGTLLRLLERSNFVVSKVAIVT